MAVYREGYKAKELIERNSKKIFQDACDYGAPAKKGDAIYIAATQLATMYGDEITRRENRYPTGRSVSINFTLIDEWAVSDERKTIEEAYEFYRLDFISCTEGACKGYDGYVSIIKI
jgi:hypothetical protein